MRRRVGLTTALFAFIGIAGGAGLKAQTLPNSTRMIPVAHTAKSFHVPDTGPPPDRSDRYRRRVFDGGLLSSGFASDRTTGTLCPTLSGHAATSGLPDRNLPPEANQRPRKPLSCSAPSKTYRDCALTGAELAVETIALCDRLLLESKEDSKMEITLTAMREQTVKIHLPLLLKAARGLSAATPVPSRLP